MKASLILIFCNLLLFIPASAQSSGGQFAITQSVIANGGANSSGGNFTVTGTTAQTTVGVNPAGGNFAVAGGFWQAFLAPTAAQVSVSGRVTAANGIGIANVRVTMTNQSGESVATNTNSFGNFSFMQVQAGEIYVLTVSSRRYQFSVPTQVLSVGDNVNNLIFIADLE